ncbi:hypothetical protein [Candidatus Poriferisodalis sp.]|uniref:hypothetical protein n=1 Tax=Candidatus Poriferisodalis sp. TaxID=3101277 RepID=UPI003B02E067
MSSASKWLTEDQCEQLREFRQGDVLSSLKRHTWLAHGDSPTTEHARRNVEAGHLSAIGEDAPHGHAILTQTCDLMPRRGIDPPFVALAPLAQLEGNYAAQGRLGRLTRYAHLPAYRDGSYFADLERIITAESGVLLWHGCAEGLSNDQERNDFTRAVARKFNRFAFPDDVPRSLDKWRSHVVTKHGKENSPEGAFYREALDVRISVDPDWDKDAFAITVILLFPPDFLPEIDPLVNPPTGVVHSVNRLSAAEIAHQLQERIDDPSRAFLMCDRLQKLWSEQCTPMGAVKEIKFEFISAEVMTVYDYRRSFSFDLEFLSSS